MKQVIDMIKIAYEWLTKLSTRILAILIIGMPLLLYIVYMGYTTNHKRNSNMVKLIQKVNMLDSCQAIIIANQQIQSEQIQQLKIFIDQSIKISDIKVIQSTAEQMKFLLKWNKENSSMLLESIDKWSNTFEKSAYFETPEDTVLKREFKINVIEKND